MKKILIDMDDVIYKNVYLSVINKIMGTNKKREECVNYKVENNFEGITQEQTAQYYKNLGNGDVYQNAEFLEDCKEVLEKLSHKYELYICSAVVIGGNVEGSGSLFVEKFNLICKELPFINPNNVIFSSNKNMFKADVMIDDKASNLQANNKKLKLLFTAAHNKNLSQEELKQQGITRVNNWKEVEKILL